MKKRLLALFLAFVMAMSLLPVSVFADGGTGGQMQGTKDNPITANSNGVTVNKYVSQGEDGQYNLTLEAYASNQLTTTTTTTPLDIVLVLDTSGSMKDKLEGTHYEAIADKTEWSFNDVNSYDGTLYCKKGDHYYEVKGDYNWWSNSDYKLQYHAGWFDWKDLTETSDDPNATLYTGELYQRVSGTSKIEAMQAAVNNFIDSVKTNSLKDEKVYHQIGIVEFASDGYIKANLTNVETEADSLKTTVNSFVASGATAVDYALNKASDVLDSARSNAQKVVVLFTDGEPNHGNGFDRKVAATAINKAQTLKASGVTIYTIGVFADAKPDDTTGDFNKYMNAVSSRYPQATATGGTDYHDRTLTVDWGKDTEKQYYFAADSAESLDDVFQNIADEVTTGTLTSNPDAGSVLSDTMSQYFKFPEGITTNDVTVQFAEAKSYSEKDGFTFNDPGVLPGGVAPTVEISGDIITVTGFNYKANAASYNKTDGSVSGGKLVITFPIEINENACNEDTTITDGYYPTNSTAELFYKGSAASTTNDTRTTLSDSPEVSHTKPAFMVTWMSQDGKTTLETDENVTYGKKPSYDGNEPTKPADDKYTYTFAGWATQAGQEIGVAEENLDKVTGPITYYAAFSKTEITKYTVTYEWSGLPEDTTAKIPDPITGLVAGATYNVDGTYTSTTTVKDADGNQYTFSGWKLNGAVVTGTQTIDAGSVKLTGTWEKTGVPPIDPNPKVAAYKVEHYYVKGTQVTLHETEFPLYGEIGTTVNATAKTYNNYVYDPNYEGTVASGVVIMPTAGDDGKPIILTLKLYYTYVPTAPEEEDLPGILGESAVRVNCVNSQVSHGVKDFGVLSGGCSIGAVEGDKDSGYTCTVTVNAAPYVAAYNQEYATAPIHTLIPGEAETKTITLTWDDYKDEWIASLTAVPVHFDVKCQTYSLAYNANGGKMNGYDMFTALGIQANSAYKLGSEEGYSIPTKGDDVFMGWTADQSAGGKVYGAGEKLPEVVTTVEIPTVTTVYAVWGDDSNGDEIADATQVMIEPAAITIYTGGTGYTGVVVDKDGNVVNADADGNGLPIPGFYFTLPYEMNEAIQKDAGTGGNAADLSKYLKITTGSDDETNTDERTWEIHLYNENGTSNVGSRYVYRFQPVGGTGNDDLRMQFTNKITVGRQDI